VILAEQPRFTGDSVQSCALDATGPNPDDPLSMARVDGREVVVYPVIGDPGADGAAAGKVIISI
jgi:hypothetical protein